jgi:nucleoside-diphosphate-sugar epimerase
MTAHAPKPILVLGATGKTGGRVAQRLTERGIALRAGSRAAEPPFDWDNHATWPTALRGDRQLNRALHTVILHRRQHDPATRDYTARRITEGKSARDAVRLLKRYLARHVYRVMQNSTPLTT